MMKKITVFITVSAIALAASAATKEAAKAPGRDLAKVSAKKIETQKSAQLQALKDLDAQEEEANNEALAAFEAKTLKNKAPLQRGVELKIQFASLVPARQNESELLTTELQNQVRAMIQAEPVRTVLPLIPENIPAPVLRDTSVLGIKPDYLDMSKIDPVTTVKALDSAGNVVESPLADGATVSNMSKTLAVKTTVKVDPLQTEFKNKWETFFTQRFPVLNHYYFSKSRNYRYAYRAWFDHGFAGGYFYPVLPWENVEKDLIYPIPHWLFSNEWSPDYYENVLGAYYAARSPVKPFAYAGAWFPTETLRTLALDMSGFLGPDIYKQEDFRIGLGLLTASLAEQLSENTVNHFGFGLGEIVLTHYENVRNAAVEVDGFVDRADFHVPFKGLIDLESPARTLAYLPHGPSPDLDGNFFYLDQINRSLERLGENPFQFFDEPAGPDAPFGGIACDTFSSVDLGSVDKKYWAFDEDGGAAYDKAIKECTDDAGADFASTNIFECAANVSCHDGIPYNDISVCTAKSGALSFSVHGRDPDVDARRATERCTADDSSDDAQCASGVTCADNGGKTLKTTSCTTTSMRQSFSAESLVPERARSQAVENCLNDSRTDDDQCWWNVICSTK